MQISVSGNFLQVNSDMRWAGHTTMLDLIPCREFKQTAIQFDGCSWGVYQEQIYITYIHMWIITFHISFKCTIHNTGTRSILIKIMNIIDQPGGGDEVSKRACSPPPETAGDPIKDNNK